MKMKFSKQINCRKMKKSKEKGYFGVEEETNAEFSIEEDYIIEKQTYRHFDERKIITEALGKRK